MPHYRGDGLYPHLQLLREEANPSRRKPGFPGGAPPDRGTRADFGAALTRNAEALEEQVRALPSPAPGVQPHLVFRIPVATGTTPVGLADRLEAAGLVVVAIESDNAIVAFRADADLAGFKAAVAQYVAGPRDGINRLTGRPYESTPSDIFEYIEPGQMRPWARSDRIGPRLAHAIGLEGDHIEPERQFVLDVELWLRGALDLFQASLAELEAALAVDETAGKGGTDRVCDQFRGQTLWLCRVKVSGTTLERLLELGAVAEIDLPPTPHFDAAAAHRVTPRDYPACPAPPVDGPRLCILDSGIASSHPLLAANVGHEEAILTQKPTAADMHGHGTMVGGIGVYGNVRASYLAGSFSSPITLFSARVLNDQNEFDDERLIIDQMREAITLFTESPYDCRVFNLSLGDTRVLPAKQGGRQTLWAEQLDILARELKVLLVVSAGNNENVFASNPSDAESVVTGYPEVLFREDAALCDPATAAIPITVGGLAAGDVPEVRPGPNALDITLAVAARDQPSPFTRVGPGINGALKPEFVAEGGNALFDGFGTARRLIRGNDAGLAVMSLERDFLTSMFSFDSGTSFAAPAVARQAALLWHQLKLDMGRDPHPNLVRALLATSASVPWQAADVITAARGESAILDVCGYGVPDEALATRSSDRRVTLIAEDSMQLDTFCLYQIPVPPELLTAVGKKRFVIGLAFDPPVRRRRAEYLGVRISCYLLRGKTPEQIEKAYRAITPEERKSKDFEKAIQGRSNCQLSPGNKRLGRTTLHRREWEFTHGSLGDGDTYYLLVRAERSNWLPASVVAQDFAVAVTIAAEEPRLYNLIQQRLQVQSRVRVRT